MKKMAIFSAVLTIVFTLFICTSQTYAITTDVIDNSTESRLVEIKNDELKSLEDYQQKYGSDSYGLTAYILNLLRIYSIPFCFLGIVIAAIYQYIIGVRHYANSDKGTTMMFSSVTVLVICQILPLIFAIIVKFGRG